MADINSQAEKVTKHLKEGVFELEDFSKKLEGILTDYKKLNTILESTKKSTESIFKFNTKIAQQYKDEIKSSETNINNLTKEAKLLKDNYDSQRDITRLAKEKLKNDKKNFSDAKKELLSTTSPQRKKELTTAVSKDGMMLYNIENSQKELELAKSLENSIKYKLGLKKNEIQVNKLAIADSKKMLNTQLAINKNILSTMNDLAGSILVAMLKKSIQNFIAIDVASFSIRKNFGLLNGDFDVLQNNMKSITLETLKFGATFDDVAEITNAIGDNFNGLVASNRELVKNATVLSKQLGISGETSIDFLHTMSSISNSTVEAQDGMIGFAKQMANAAGIPLGKLMSQISIKSDEIRIFTGASATNLIKSAVSAKLMGSDIEKIAKTSKLLLDFNTSVNDELEASVLLGQDINLQYARELSFKKDIVGANREILRIANQVNFDQLNPFQAEAFAKALGKSVVELQDMKQAEKEIDFIRNTPILRKQLDTLEHMKSLRENESKELGKQAELRLMNLANQEKLAQVQNQWNALLSTASAALLPIVSEILSIAIRAVQVLNGGGLQIFALIEGAAGGLRLFTEVLSLLTIGGFKALNIFKSFSGLLGIFGAVGKWIPVIGWIITAFSFVSNLMKRWDEFPDGFIGGLKAIGSAIIDTLVGPFYNAFKTIWGWFGGNSPSMLGLGILDGIVSIGSMLYNALISPFVNGYNFISGLFGGSKIKSLVDVEVDQSSISKQPSNNTTSKATVSDTIVETNKIISDKLDELISLMKNGGIAVNLDGSKVSYALGKVSRERGSFGTI
jgi:hypothetical protein